MARKKNRKSTGRKQTEKKPTSIQLAMLRLSEGVLGRLLRAATVHHDESYPMSRQDWGYVTSDGNIYLNPRLDADPKEWMYVIAHCLLHLGLDHLQEDRLSDPNWNVACDLVVTNFLTVNRIGSPTAAFARPIPLTVKSEEETCAKLRDLPEREGCLGFGTMSGRPDMVWNGQPRPTWWQTAPPDFPQIFAQSLQEAMEASLEQASGGRPDAAAAGCRRTVWGDARSWFLSSYPLLGAVAAAFRLVDDEDVAVRMQIPVAAVHSELQEIYINPRCRCTQEEWQFILAHEFLHAALRHDLRCEGRHPQLWNVACDFVINAWLLDMNVGVMPAGALYDDRFRGLSAEAVYDQIWEDLRYYTGQGAPRDILYGNGSDIDSLAAQDLDDFYRSALQRGLIYHQEGGRGYIPAGLIEEIHALSRPPIRWDVELAKWFDEQITVPEKRRTYSRISRRQSSTPDIPRPAWRYPEEDVSRQTFAVLLDTSGSMDRHLLAAALGSIASYSVAREVGQVRVVFCDAAAYDQGMMSPEDIAGAVHVRGRGGTKLQPGIDLLDKDKMFPRSAPLLIITDGACDTLRVSGREHAYLIPRHCRLPFIPKGPVFKLQ